VTRTPQNQISCQSRVDAAHFSLLSDIFDAANPASFGRASGHFRRGGALAPKLLLALLLRMVADAGRGGYQLLLEHFWHEAARAGLELPTQRPVTASALCQARDRLDPAALRHLVHVAAARFEDEYGAEHRWRGRRLLAVDGSRFATQRSDALRQRFGAPAGGHCPQVSVSTLFDLVSKVPVDVAIDRFGSNEREALLREHFTHLAAGDVLILDRGYPSYDVLTRLIASPAHYVVRVPVSSGFPAVADFVASGARDAEIEIAVPRDYGKTDLSPLRVRAVRIDAPETGPTVVLTSLPREEVDGAAVNELYRLRWEIEEYYKLVKSNYLGQGQFHSKKPAGVEQEIYATALFVSICRHMMAAAARVEEVEYAELGQKRAVLAVARDITCILLHTQPKDARRILLDVCRAIALRTVRPRPGRHYPRRSFRSPSRWIAGGKRGAKPAIA